jgi:hypothetical protein
MESPYQTPTEPAKGFGGDNASGLFEPLYQKRIWIRILGIALILLGALYCITIIGAIFGIPMIFAGVFMNQAAGHIEAGFMGNPARLYEGSRKLASALQMGGIIILIISVIMILYFGAIIMMLFFGIAAQNF